MRFMDIAKVAKGCHMAVIVTDFNENQWINTGGAAYKLEGLPPMSADSFLNLLGIGERKKQDWYKEDQADKEGIFKPDRYAEEELTADDAGISIAYNGKYLTPIYRPGGVIWLDLNLMAPVVNAKTEYLRFFAREQGGKYVIAVKDGLILIALIAEFEMSEDLRDKLELLYTQCNRRLRGSDYLREE